MNQDFFLKKKSKKKLSDKKMGVMQSLLQGESNYLAYSRSAHSKIRVVGWSPFCTISPQRG
jgi:hypothetical protein